MMIADPTAGQRPRSILRNGSNNKNGGDKTVTFEGAARTNPVIPEDTMFQHKLKMDDDTRLENTPNYLNMAQNIQREINPTTKQPNKHANNIMNDIATNQTESACTQLDRIKNFDPLEQFSGRVSYLEFTLYMSDAKSFNKMLDKIPNEESNVKELQFLKKLSTQLTNDNGLNKQLTEIKAKHSKPQHSTDIYKDLLKNNITNLTEFLDSDGKSRAQEALNKNYITKQTSDNQQQIRNALEEKITKINDLKQEVTTAVNPTEKHKTQPQDPTENNPILSFFTNFTNLFKTEEQRKTVPTKHDEEEKTKTIKKQVSFAATTTQNPEPQETIAAATTQNPEPQKKEAQQNNNPAPKQEPSFFDKIKKMFGFGANNPNTTEAEAATPAPTTTQNPQSPDTIAQEAAAEARRAATDLAAQTTMSSSNNQPSPPVIASADAAKAAQRG